MTHLQTLKEKIAGLERRLEQVRQLQILAGHDSWKAMRALLEAELLAKVNRVCDISCTHEQAIGLRHEIQTLRWFLRAPQVKEELVRNTVETIKGLQAKVDRITVLGIGQAAEAHAEIDKAHQALQGTTP